MQYTEEQRRDIIATFKGLTVEEVEYVEASDDAGPNPYWVLYLSNGSEVAIRFMSEICDELPAGV